MKKTYLSPVVNCLTFLPQNVIVLSPKKNELEEDWG